MIELVTLRALPVFKEYDERDLAVLLGSSSEREYAPGEAICEEGVRVRSCFLVVEGEVDVVRATPEGPLRMGHFGAGMFLGQIALVDGKARTSTVRAITPVRALEFTRDVFEALVRARSPLALRFQRQIAVAGIRKLRGATAQLLELLSAEAREAPAPEGAAEPTPSDRTRDVLRYIQATVDELGIPMEQITETRQDRVPTRPMSSSPPRRRA